jgi:hypothetical protein
MKRPVRIIQASHVCRHPYSQFEESARELGLDRRAPVRTRKPTQRFSFNLRAGVAQEGVSLLRLVE